MAALCAIARGQLLLPTFKNYEWNYQNFLVEVHLISNQKIIQVVRYTYKVDEKKSNPNLLYYFIQLNWTLTIPLNPVVILLMHDPSLIRISHFHELKFS